MSVANEPADAGYVALTINSDTFEIWRRRDDWAQYGGLDVAHWFSCTDMQQETLTWGGLTCRGRLAYVGEFRNMRATHERS